LLNSILNSRHHHFWILGRYSLETNCQDIFLILKFCWIGMFMRV
jgi:TctA family transporter